MKWKALFMAVIPGLLLGIAFIAAPAAPARVSPTHWVRAYGANDYLFDVSDVYEAPDGSVAGGSLQIYDGVVNDRDAWLVRLDEEGEVVWQRSIGAEDAIERMRGLRPSGDGFLIVGDIGPYEGDPDAWAVSLDGAGAIAWQKQYVGSAEDVFESAVVTEDGYVAVGATRSFGAGNLDGWVVRLNGDGSVAWQKVYGGGEDDAFRDVVRTADGDLIVVGYTKSFGAGFKDVWALRLDEGDGSIVWQRSYGAFDFDEAWAVRAAPHGFVVAADTSLTGAGLLDAWVLKLDPDGTLLWHKAYGGSDWDSARGLAVTADGEIVFAGQTASFADDPYNGWVLRLSGAGVPLWQRSIGSDEWSERLASVDETADGDLLLAGETDSLAYEDFWVMDVSAQGLVDGCVDIAEIEATVTRIEATAGESNATVQDSAATTMDTTAVVTETVAQTAGMCEDSISLSEYDDVIPVTPIIRRGGG